MTSTTTAAIQDGLPPSDAQTKDQMPFPILLCRCFAWGSIALVTAFLINNYLTHWQGWTAPFEVFSSSEGFAVLALLQLLVYVFAIIGTFYYVFSTQSKLLRADSQIIYNTTNFIIRAAFWSVLIVGTVDMLISFLRVEDLLDGIVGEDISSGLNRSEFRGIYVHFPILVLGVLIACFHRGLGFPWLALVVVMAELLIVITRFIFSYEQAFMGDLVRFWYASLFLFASAYTLYEEGHVRVDVLYSVFSDRMRGIVNALGSVLLGMTLCWIIVILGMGDKTSIINSPILNYEVTQTGFGMFVKYWMAGFLAVFAVSMLFQFAGYFLEGIADIRGEPGKRVVNSEHM